MSAWAPVRLAWDVLSAFKVLEGIKASNHPIAFYIVLPCVRGYATGQETAWVHGKSSPEAIENLPIEERAVRKECCAHSAIATSGIQLCGFFRNAELSETKSSMLATGGRD